MQDVKIEEIKELTLDDAINVVNGRKHNRELSKAEVFILAQEYLQRQQGKIAIYLRMNGISPAKSTSWLL